MIFWDFPDCESMTWMFIYRLDMGYRRMDGGLFSPDLNDPMEKK